MVALQKTTAWLEASRRLAATTMASVDEVERGLPLSAAEKLSAAISPKDGALKYRFVRKATYARRRARQGVEEALLSKEESERIVRVARIWAFASKVWGGSEGARRFMGDPHILLDGKSPLDVSLSGELGGRLVEDILGHLAYGSAA